MRGKKGGGGGKGRVWRQVGRRRVGVGEGIVVRGRAPGRMCCMACGRIWVGLGVGESQCILREEEGEGEG